jgi:cytochrome c
MRKTGTQEAQEAQEIGKLPYFLCLLCLLCSLPLAGQESHRTTWDGVYTEAQAKRGESIYIDSCSNCHGRTLEGLDMTPPLSGGAFMSNWDGLSIGDLVDRIRSSMPLDRPGALSRQENVDVVAYILRFDQFPAGKDELPRDTQILKQIQFKARQ